METYATINILPVMTQLQYDRDKGQKRMLITEPLGLNEGRLEYQEAKSYDPEKRLEPGDKLIYYNQTGYYLIYYMKTY